jgi:hypothetical protein
MGDVLIHLETLCGLQGDLHLQLQLVRLPDLAFLRDHGLTRQPKLGHVR